tara:strand:- start:1035 stop:1175 length:141 start_codon:yes stop_codon:yes gene_type:complete
MINIRQIKERRRSKKNFSMSLITTSSASTTRLGYFEITPAEMRIKV